MQSHAWLSSCYSPYPVVCKHGGLTGQDEETLILQMKARAVMHKHKQVNILCSLLGLASLEALVFILFVGFAIKSV